MSIDGNNYLKRILEILETKKPSTILEISNECGKIGLLVRCFLEELKGLEKKEIIMDALQIDNEINPINKYLYDSCYYGNIISKLDELPQYDVIILDGFFEFKKSNVENLLEPLLKHSNYVIVYTPVYKSIGNQTLWSYTNFYNYDFDYFCTSAKNSYNDYHIFCFKKICKNKMNNIIKIHREEIENPLNITYILPHKNLTGGLKMLLEQMKSLKKRGHKITALLKDNNAKKVIPDWYDLKVDNEIVISQDESYSNYIFNTDIIVLGWIAQLLEISDLDIPLVYWEQGSEWIFGDFIKTNYISIIDTYLQKCYSTECHMASVSPYVQKVLHTKYNKITPVILNGIDVDFYYPAENYNQNRILIVGNPQLKFKGFDLAFLVLDKIANMGYDFSVDWVSQIYPQKKEKKYSINYITKPSQEELAECYRKADIFLFTSKYEGFGMPPLEAMASGTPVVCTNSGGVASYIQDGFNALTADYGDIDKLAAEIIFLLKHPQAREFFSKNGRETALKLSIENSVNSFEDFLYSVYKKEL